MRCALPSSDRFLLCIRREGGRRLAGVLAPMIYISCCISFCVGWAGSWHASVPFVCILLLVLTGWTIQCILRLPACLSVFLCHSLCRNVMVAAACHSEAAAGSSHHGVAAEMQACRADRQAGKRAGCGNQIGPAVSPSLVGWMDVRDGRSCEYFAAVSLPPSMHCMQSR